MWLIANFGSGDSSASSRTSESIPSAHGFLPGRDSFSSSTVCAPERAAVQAAITPAGPAPITATSQLLMIEPCRYLGMLNGHVSGIGCNSERVRSGHGDVSNLVQVGRVLPREARCRYWASLLYLLFNSVEEVERVYC